MHVDGCYLDRENNVRVWCSDIAVLLLLLHDDCTALVGKVMERVEVLIFMPVSAFLVLFMLRSQICQMRIWMCEVAVKPMQTDV